MARIEVEISLHEATSVLCSELLDQFFQDEKARGLSDLTIKNRRFNLRALPGYDPGTVAEYCRERNLSPGYHNELAKTSRQYCRWAAENFGYHNPWTKNVVIPAMPTSVGDPLSDEEVERVLAHPKLHNYAVLALYAGLRTAEICRISSEDLVKSARGYELRIVGKGNKAATIPAHAEVVKVIQSATSGVSANAGRIFPGTTPKGISNACGRYFREVGILRGRLHRLRATYANRVYKATGDLVIVQHAMRHSSLAVTQAYLGLDQEALHNAVLSL